SGSAMSLVRSLASFRFSLMMDGRLSSPLRSRMAQARHGPGADRPLARTGTRLVVDTVPAVSCCTDHDPEESSRVSWRSGGGPGPAIAAATAVRPDDHRHPGAAVRG